MNITDLIEYPPRRLWLIQQAIEQGIDIQQISNPSLPDYLVEKIMELSKYGITDFTEEELQLFQQKRNPFAWEILKYGYLTNKRHQPFQQLTGSERFIVEEKLGYEPDFDKYEQECRHKNINTFHTAEYTYVIETGRRHLLEDEDPYTQEWMVQVISLELDNWDEIYKQAMNKFDYYNRHDLYRLCTNEYKLKGKVEMSIDEGYTIEEREYILDCYRNTGIDLRLLPYPEIIQPYKYMINRNYYEKLKEYLTVDELKFYREESNKFRKEYDKDITHKK